MVISTITEIDRIRQGSFHYGNADILLLTIHTPFLFVASAYILGEHANRFIMVDYTEQRKHMIEGHLLPSGVRDPALLSTIKQIHRENFLPDELKHLAYIDDDIRLDNDNFLLRPNDLLRMILALNVTKNDNVLDIACTTGYSSVILGFLADSVVGLEQSDTFLAKARELVHLEGFSNVIFVTGAYEKGFANKGPYDCILLQRAYSEVPEALLEQLKENGRLTYIRQSSETFGQAWLVEKHHGSISQRPLFELCVPIFHEPKDGFSFQ